MVAGQNVLHGRLQSGAPRMILQLLAVRLPQQLLIHLQVPGRPAATFCHHRLQKLRCRLCGKAGVPTAVLNFISHAGCGGQVVAQQLRDQALLGDEAEEVVQRPHLRLHHHLVGPAAVRRVCGYLRRQQLQGLEQLLRVALRRRPTRPVAVPAAAVASVHRQ